MAATNAEAPSTGARKVRRLGIAVAIVVALYSVGWYAVASKIETDLGDFLRQGGGRPFAVTCDQLETAGFPFLIGVNCDRTAFADARTGDRVEAGAFRIAARVYNPGTFVTEIDGPAAAGFGNGVRADGSWTRLAASGRAWLDGLSRLSVVSDMPQVKLSFPALMDAIQLTAASGEAHFRTVDNSLEVAAIAREFQWRLEGQAPLIDKISASADILLDNQAELLKGNRPASKAMTGTLKSFRIEMAGGLYGSLTGPFTINEDGYLSGEFAAHLENIDLWQKTLVTLFPEADATISGMAVLLKGLGKDGSGSDVTLNLSDGLITLSMMPLGHIPPL